MDPESITTFKCDFIIPDLQSSFSVPTSTDGSDNLMHKKNMDTYFATDMIFQLLCNTQTIVCNLTLIQFDATIFVCVILTLH